jgi:branched-chain amino acid transport system ATP-binding protein
MIPHPATACGANVARPLLEVVGLCKYYGQLAAVSNVSFSVKAGEIVGLIGPNGAGKTTLVGLLSGAIRPSDGDIRFRDRSIVGLRPHNIGQLGIIRTFQVVQPFLHLTVRECAMLGALFGCSEGGNRRVSAARVNAEMILEFVGLDHKADAPAEQLNIPERKRLELARVLAARPTLLLLDEVMAGLSANEVKEMIELVRGISKNGVSVIFVEHMIDAVNTLCNRIVVLHHGEKVADGSLLEIAAQNALVNDYLGTHWRSAKSGV